MPLSSTTPLLRPSGFAASVSSSFRPRYRYSFTVLPFASRSTAGRRLSKRTVFPARQRGGSKARSSVPRPFLLPRPSFACSDPVQAVGDCAPGPFQPPPTPPSLTPPPSTPPSPTSLLPKSYSLPRYAPFACCSINLLTCSSNSGKTRILTEICLLYTSPSPRDS